MPWAAIGFGWTTNQYVQAGRWQINSVMLVAVVPAKWTQLQPPQLLGKFPRFNGVK